MTIKKISKEIFNEFSSNHKYGSYYQTSEYGELMETIGYKSSYIGIYDEEALIGASLILIKKLVFKYSYGYAPRGFLVDYNYENIFKDITEALRSYFRNGNVIMLKIDPPVGDKSVTEKLIERGYSHFGYNNDFKTFKPRWNMVINMENTTREELFSKFDKSVKNKIRTAERKGITIYRGNENHIHMIYSFVKKQRSNKMKYYDDLYDIFNRNNMVDIYLAKIDTYKYLNTVRKKYSEETYKNDEYSKKILENINNNSKYIEKKMISDRLISTYKRELMESTNLIRKFPDGIVIGGAIIIKHKNNIFFSIDGINEKYKNFYPNHLMKWKIIEEYLDKGYKYVDLNGITGDFDKNSKFYGLYEFKKGFNSKAIEYIGEFTIITNRRKHFFYSLILKIKNLFRFDDKLEY